MDVIPANEVQIDPQPAASAPSLDNPSMAQPQQSEVIPDSAVELDSDKYGGLGQQALAGIEGVGRGLTLGLSDVAERGLGLSTPEAMRGRMEANPVTSTAGTILGGAGLVGLTGGIAAPAEAGLAGTLAATGAEGAIFGAGNAISDAALGDGNLNAQHILADIGTGAALGVGVGALGQGIKGIIGKFGNVKGSIAEAMAAESASANQEAKTAEAIAKEAGLKENAPEILKAAQAIGAPTTEASFSNNPYVQKLTDSLVNGAPTYAGEAKKAIYDAGFNAVKGTTESVLPQADISKSQLGSALQGSLSAKIAEKAKPFDELYSAIKDVAQTIPLKENSAPAIARNINKFISDPSIGKHSPAAKLASQIADEIGDLKTVDDLRGYQSGLNSRLSGASASPAEKRIIGIVRDKLDQWEQRAIKDYASEWSSKVDLSNPEEASIWGPKVEQLQSLVKNIDAADAQYAPFRKNLTELSEWLGKGKVGGAKDAIDFITNRLEPEDIANRLSQKKYAGMYSFFEKNFPEESAVIKEYQKAALREASLKEGEFSPRKFFTNFNKLEPEIKKAIFAPDELEKLQHAETFLNDGLPKNFNPSGTSGMSAARAFFESPTGAAISNARDFGIDAYIKHIASLPEEYRPNPVTEGMALSQKYNALRAAQKMADKTAKRTTNAVKSVFGIGGGAIIAPAVLGTHSYDQRVEKIKQLSEDPEALSNQTSAHIDSLHQNLPNVSQGIATSMARSVAYLNSVRPKTNENNLPLSPKLKVPEDQKQKFNKIYDVVNDPVSILHFVKHGTITLDQIHAIQATHPEMYDDMKKQLLSFADPDSAKKLPYHTKKGIALFLGQPLDQSMLQPVLLANQTTFAAPQANPGATKKARSTSSGLKELNIAKNYKTTISREKDDEA